MDLGNVLIDPLLVVVGGYGRWRVVDFGTQFIRSTLVVSVVGELALAFDAFAYLSPRSTPSRTRRPKSVHGSIFPRQDDELPPLLGIAGTVEHSRQSHMREVRRRLSIDVDQNVSHSYVISQRRRGLDPGDDGHGHVDVDAEGTAIGRDVDHQRMNYFGRPARVVNLVVLGTPSPRGVFRDGRIPEKVFLAVSVRCSKLFFFGHGNFELVLQLVRFGGRGRARIQLDAVWIEVGGSHVVVVVVASDATAAVDDCVVCGSGDVPCRCKIINRPQFFINVFYPTIGAWKEAPQETSVSTPFCLRFLFHTLYWRLTLYRTVGREAWQPACTSRAALKKRPF